jgi:AraC-like DNA-binding protein
MGSEARKSSELLPPRGSLRAPKPDGLLDGRRIVPSEKLASYVHHFWWIQWALRSPYTADTLPHPSMQILHRETPARSRADVVGVHTGRLARRLVGDGQTFGITFRPVMFHPLLGASASMATYTDRIVPLGRVLGAKAMTWARAMHDARNVDEKVAIADALLSSLLPPPDPPLTRLRDLVERMSVDRSILRVEDVCEASGMDRRALQRAFRIYVGASPKWVIQRYRLHEAAAQLTAPNPPTLAALAASLGYADQAHFGRDFKRTVGETPRAFGRMRSR